MTLKAIWLSDDAALISQTQHTQLLLFVVEYGLSELWKSFGISPDYVIGHSVGEYVAAVVAGVFDLESGLKLIYHRARLMQSLPEGGGMLVVLADIKTVKSAIKEQKQKVSIAAINAPRQIVVSGDKPALEKLESQFKNKDIRTIKLNVSHAFHSYLMDSILDEFKQIAKTIEYKKPNITLISNVTGDVLSAAQLNADYWVSHIKEGVNFAGGINTLSQKGCDVYLEVGPGAVLTGLGQQSVSDTDAIWLSVV